MSHLQRRHLLLAATALPLGANAHHGWSSFDPERPLYLEGTVRKVRWQNPHAELDLELPAGLKLPPDLAQRPLPAQTAPVDGKALLTKTVLPTRKDKVWEIELAPLTRMQAWQVQEVNPGASLSVVGFTLREEKGEAVLRAEYLFVDGKTYALRSGPA
ncbi:MAG: hypothetical protein KKG67_00525 [Gammaproteobacteria bacterium]|nr:hypothetical protein [Gammaproteobacteria bacterium]